MRKKSRNLLTYLLVLVFTLGSFTTTALSASDTSSEEDVNASEEKVVSLKEVYEDHFLIGNIVNPWDLEDSSADKYEFMKYHFNTLTPENATKPDSLWDDSTGNPSFSQADDMLAQVNEDGFSTKGHTLVWHNQSEDWPPSGQNYTEARESLERYISTVAGHYSEGTHKLDGWDVINEAMRDNPENPTDWRNALRSGINPTERAAKWFEAYADGGNGWDYIYDAFLFAREADPDATLYYNDFNDEELPNKAIAIASMVNELNERYANEHPEANGRKLIEGIGIQGHYNTRLNVDNLEEVIKIYKETGAELSITELDVQINGVSDDNPPTEEQFEEQAEMYAKLFSLYKKYSDYIDRVTFWGVDDNSTWRSDGYPLPFDGDREPKEAYWAIINPEAYLGLDEEAPELTSFEFDGEVFDMAGKTEFDVNVPKDVSNVDFSAANVVHEYSDDDVDVSVTLNPESGTVSDGEPAEATVEIAWTESPNISTTYTINFGHMTAEWENDQNYPDTGYRSTVNIRFSDGETEPELFQAFYNQDDGKLAKLNSKQFQSLPKHTSDTFTINTDSSIDSEDLEPLMLNKSLRDQNGASIIPTRVTDLSTPESYYKLAKTIESGSTYIVVSDSGHALTNMNEEPVPPSEKRGLASTPVTIDDDVIVEPEVIQDNTRFIFDEKSSPDPGSYTSENGYTGHTMLSLVHGGLVAPSIMYRDFSDDDTVALRTDSTIANSDLDRAVWFNTGVDSDTGETTLFSHTESSNETYALHGNEDGFVSQRVGSLEDDAAPRVKLYEYVSDYLTVDSVSPSATVESHKGNENRLTVNVTELYSDGSTEDFTEEILISNNAADIYHVGPYKVYVDTKGNDKIRESYIVWD
ncbi:hypothetical protein D7Z54_24585 [Salibacterium salarium]|uniref:Beta-xylanase n=1 Tax=Salibacterium salarium TaxID=284579 RepID=A0A3R9QPU5_9BACI|nr:endo-1,4-beta-xylanase [Salibacterium salarium]RSL30677.1 hypothetical protein D7Z54_24585 [Salibacterium salarium]